jgi:hypothetical protein
MLEASIRFYPRLIYMDINEKYKSVTLENASNIDNIYKLSFGYTKVKNNKFIRVEDKDLTKEERSFCSNLRIFPRKIALKPGEKQTVRMTIRNLDKSKFTGAEYYCRIYAKAQPKPQILKNNIKGVKTILQVVLSVGAPIHIRTQNDIKLDLKVKPYGYRIKNGYLFYKVSLSNKSTMGVRGTLVLEINDKRTNKIVKTIKQGFVNQGGDTTLIIKKRITDLDMNKNKYDVQVKLFDSEGVDLDFHLFDYQGIKIEEFDLK